MEAIPLLPVSIAFATLVRWAISLNPYSGYGEPPMYGDYEAQRHWMELTLHLPSSKWYFYDSDYWPLDYPPLSAYASWICGWIGHYFFNQEWFELELSRGYESPSAKLYMRATVLIFELLIYFPAVFYFLKTTPNLIKKQNWPGSIWFLVMLLQPGLIIIDHGHFQYNAVMLGLALGAFACFQADRKLLGSVFFCTSLMFKQMALYYALPVFFYLLGEVFRPTSRREGWRSINLAFFLKLSITVIFTFAVCLGPFLSFKQMSQVVARLFPLQRGLYEDKVANVWCALNSLIKLRNLAPPTFWFRFSALITLIGCLPSCLCLFGCHRRPTQAAKDLFIYALASSSLSFFLFSFQVHEKTILLPALPITMLMFISPASASGGAAGDASKSGGGGEGFWLGRWFNVMAVFSMQPLLKREGLILPLLLLTVLWIIITDVVNPFTKSQQREEGLKKRLNQVFLTVAALIWLADALITPPQKLPDLWVVANVTWSAGYFGLVYFNLNYQVWKLFWTTGKKDKES